MAGTTRVLALACVLAALSPAVGRADDAEKAAQTFDALFGADLKRVRETPDARDDAELAARLLDAARKAADQPALLTVLCEKACDLSVGSPSGLATAAQAMELLAAGVPDKAAASRERLLEIRQKQFDAARGDDKKAAGEALLDGLMPLIEDQEKAGALVEAAALCRRAQTVARAAVSPRRAEIDARADALALRMKAARRVDDVKALLARDPQNVGIRESLVRMYLVELDDPAGAATCLDGCKDADLLKYVPAAARPVEAAPELACLELGEWYRVLAEKAPAPAKAAMYGRARAYLDRFLETHPTKDLDQTRATVALGKVNESIAKLAAPPPKSAPREKSAKPEPGTVGPGRWIDLAPLVDTARDVAEGKAEREGTVLKTFSAGNMRMTVPLVAQGDYEAEFAFRRTWGPGQLSFTLPVGSADVTLIVGGVAGAFSGLEKINGRGAEKNETVIRPSKFDNDRLYVVAVRVKTTGGQTHIESTLDGSPFVQWTGPVEALAASYQVAARGCFGLGCWGAGYTFEKARVRMLSGTARPRRAADMKAAPLPAAAVKPGPWIDLVPRVDPAKDAVNGTWERQGDSLANTGGGDARTLMLPVEVTGSYELEVRFARTAGRDSVDVILPVGSAQPLLVLSGILGVAHGLEFINGKNCADNETSVKPGALQNNRVYSLHIRVSLEKDLAQVQAELDGSPLISWRGPVSAFSSTWKLPRQNTIGLASWASNVVYHSVRLRMLSGEARPLRAADVKAAPSPAAAAIKPDQWVDLAALVDPEKDAVKGEWKREGNTLVITNQIAQARIVLPVIPSGAYCLQGEFVRTAGQGDVYWQLPVGPSVVGLCLSEGDGACDGLKKVQGRDPQQAPPAASYVVKPSQIKTGRRHQVEITVRPDGGTASIGVRLDGQPYLSWSGPPTDLSLEPNWALPRAQALGVGSWKSQVAFSNLRLRMLSGAARPLRAADASAGK